MTKNSKRKSKAEKVLPAIPDKRYFTISEVGQLCAVKAYVLRYWEQEFPQLKPVKRRGNRRYYQQQDVLLVRQIRKLLYEDGFTIEGARAQLSAPPAESVAAVSTVQVDAIVQKVIEELEDVLRGLQANLTVAH